MEFKKIQTIAFFALLIGVTVLFYQLIAPYIYAIFWAGIIAALFYPAYKWLIKKIKNESISAGITVILVLLVVLLPLAGVLGLVVKQGIDTYAALSEPETITNIEQTVTNIITSPYVERITGEIDISTTLKEASSTIASIGVQWLKTGSIGTITGIVQILVMLYSLYYFLKDGEKWLKHIMLLLPFGDKNEELLYKKFVSTGKATLKGTLLLGVLQGTLGGILLAIVGIPSAAFWGLIMVVLSIIPAVGAPLVWVPGAIYLAATGHVGAAITLVIGGIAIGFVDNLLRPPLVGKDIQMHPMMILFSTIGGLALFGISGVVIGPVIATFFLAILQMYEEKYKKELHSSAT